jgi:hypothetical protein
MTYSRKKIIRGREINNSDMWGRNNNPDEYGGLNKADIAYAVRKFLMTHTITLIPRIQTYQGCDDHIHGIRGGIVIHAYIAHKHACLSARIYKLSRKSCAYIRYIYTGVRGTYAYRTRYPTRDSDLLSRFCIKCDKPHTKGIYKHT